MVTFSITFTDLKPGFQGHNILEVEFLKDGASYASTVIGNHT